MKEQPLKTSDLVPLIGIMVLVAMWVHIFLTNKP